ncbi:hypothetical protein KC866_00980 [Patescibacteria group bacterium]|nr:hypothetical protein [Patescibacteria group bacterium]
MKKIFFLLILLITFVSFSQEEESLKKWSVSTGIIFAPQGGLDLKNFDQGFTNQTNLFVTLNFSKGKSTFSSFYSLFANSVGVVYIEPIKDNFGWYGVALKGVIEDFNYVGVGGTYSIGNNSAFIEFGSSVTSWNPGIYIGAFVSIFNKKL